MNVFGETARRISRGDIITAEYLNRTARLAERGAGASPSSHFDQYVGPFGAIGAPQFVDRPLWVELTETLEAFGKGKRYKLLQENNDDDEYVNGFEEFENLADIYGGTYLIGERHLTFYDRRTQRRFPVVVYDKIGIADEEILAGFEGTVSLHKFEVAAKESSDSEIDVQAVNWWANAGSVPENAKVEVKFDYGRRGWMARLWDCPTS